MGGIWKMVMILCAGLGICLSGCAPQEDSLPVYSFDAVESSQAPQPESQPESESAAEQAPFDISKHIFQVDARSIGSGTLSRYYFSDTGWYCYLTTDFGINKHGQIISQRGKWSQTDGKLTLSAVEETTAEGGKFTDDAIAGRRITGYKIAFDESDQSETFDYAIMKDETGVYIQLGEQQLFPSIMYDHAVKVFAEEGYDAFDALPAKEKQGLWQINC